MSSVIKPKWMVRTNDFKTSPFPASAQACAKKDLVFSSLKKMGLFWLAAFFSIFIPVLHFFLVPTFLIVGIFAFFAQMKNTHYLPAGELQCPACGEKMELKNFYFQADKRFRCKHCSHQLVISEAEG